MYTQFFGNYLINNNLLTLEQLNIALLAQKNTRLKLGILAIDNGFMTEAQINEVHETQTREDKRFGDIAVSKGFLTEAQVTHLLKAQKNAYLLLGQAIVDNGFMTMADFEKHLNEYKETTRIETIDFSNEQNDFLEEVVKRFFSFEGFKSSDMFFEYVAVLFRNLVRFIGSDFTPFAPIKIETVPFSSAISQAIEGDEYIFTGAHGADDQLITFASLFAGETYSNNDEYVKDAMSEFLNLSNGIFCINMSNQSNLDFDLTPPSIYEDKSFNFDCTAYLIPVEFTFGRINFVLADGPVSIS